MRIKDIPKENRPRERLKQNGVEALSNSELLAVILQKGTRKELIYVTTFSCFCGHLKI